MYVYRHIYIVNKGLKKAARFLISRLYFFSEKRARERESVRERFKLVTGPSDFVFLLLISASLLKNEKTKKHGDFRRNCKFAPHTFFISRL